MVLELEDVLGGAEDVLGVDGAFVGSRLDMRCGKEKLAATTRTVRSMMLLPAYLSSGCHLQLLLHLSSSQWIDVPTLLTDTAHCTHNTVQAPLPSAGHRSPMLLRGSTYRRAATMQSVQAWINKAQPTNGTVLFCC
jgi:hypothetical protein